ncbi:EscU/YscU/HrcU family type III secretion system export apparatus switch protein [Terasakiella sp. A23]|uniref:EscU/YscU/HrcU family type III secretion system export apparatus switch protein n=1 Tax=Terasakiella sp. FCG-A23 TaxID=3080561 RepID=UPI002954A62E|nr:EscU/YscU/HrcU family type III secretion system export apparatus switch protein [Terasakiella sp. A23]MDV7339084.1 EscU/YscU/HrcU family type III secretion system export apparatus switch protein [Terasakiella sp. A23]
MSDGKNNMRPPNDPEQIAVALSYEGVENKAPEIIASGHGAVAEQILQIAFDQGVRVREDADLAQILSLLDVGEEIPVEAFATVAEILTYVYRANGEEMPGVDTPLKPNPDTIASEEEEN